MASKQMTFDTPDQDPWKDAEKLQGLYHGDDLKQSEIAEHFTEQGYDVTPSTISYWMNKLEIETSHTSHDSGTRSGLVEYEECVGCGEEPPGPRNGMCDTCLDQSRQKQRERQLEERGRY